MDEPYSPEPPNNSQEPEIQISALPADDSLTFRRSHLYAVLLPLAFVVGLSVGYLFWGREVPAARTARESNASQASGQPQSQAAAQGSTPREITRYDVPVDDDPYLGPSDAPITIIEFSDYECPFCRKWHAEVFEPLLAAYPDQIRFVYRDYPLSSIHPNAISAAEASNCAAVQGAFWDYHDRLFSMDLGLGTDAYLGYAKELKLDEAAFQECLADRRYQDEVQADFDFAARLGVRSTPTFFVNGLAVVGAQPFEVFKQVIDQELAGEIP